MPALYHFSHGLFIEVWAGGVCRLHASSMTTRVTIDDENAGSTGAGICPRDKYAKIRTANRTRCGGVILPRLGRIKPDRVIDLGKFDFCEWF